MSKLVLLSGALALVILPLWASADGSPRRGLRKALVAVATFNLFYVFVVRVIVPRLG